jgi:predicted membrane-bound spermidine synthase
MQVFDPISNLFLVVTASVWVAWLLLYKLKDRFHHRYLICALICSALSMFQVITYLQEQSFIKVRWDKSKILGTERVLFERWNSYSHVTVNPMGTKPHGWAMGHMPQHYHNEQLYMQIDAGAATVINRFEGSLLKVGYLKYDMVNIAYHVRPIKKVAVIGVGGGRDLLSALVFDAKHVTGIEMNPAVIEATTRRFGNFSGMLHERPDVEIVNAEGRSFLNSSNQTYDLIQIPAIDT